MGNSPAADESRNQGLTSAELDILLCQRFHETLGLFSSPDRGHGGIPRGTSPHPWRSYPSTAGQADRPNFLERDPLAPSFVL